MSADIPEGFRPMHIKVGFLDVNGPLYGKWDGTFMRLGFRVEMRHCNHGQTAHGGMMATFADMQLPFAIHAQSGKDLGFMPTVNLTCDYVSAARLGSWVEGKADLIRMTRTLVFAQGVATSDGEPCLRFNGIFKIGKPNGHIFQPEKLFAL